MRPLLSLCLTAALAIAPAARAQPQPRAIDLAAFESATEAAWGKDGLAGVTIGVVRDGKLVSTRSFGLADATSATPASADTVYRVGSVTKAFTALMLLQLVENGTVRLSDPVAKYFPEIDAIPGRLAGAPPITLLQLATHTSGLAAEPENPDAFQQGAVRDWEATLTAALAQTRFQYEPGTRFSYSNVGYAVLAVALSRAAKQPYVAYVEQHIFKPLGMTDTAFEPRASWGRRLATGYVIEDGKLDPGPAAPGHAGRGYKVPVGAIYTTVGDLSKFVALQMGDGPAGVIRPETLELASRSLITTNRGMGEGYGLGFQLFTNGDITLQGHAGGLPGYRALEVFERESDTGFIVLRNAIGGKFGDPVFLVFKPFEAVTPAG